jgi:TPR repeat protein
VLQRLVGVGQQANARAQLNLGRCYENGWSVPVDAAEALHW